MEFIPTFDYGNLDLTNEDNSICWKFSELIKTLITLSSHADRQIEIIGLGFVTDEMALDFDMYFTSSYNQFVDNGLLSEEAIQKLKNLDNFLEIRSGDKAPDFWDETTLSTNEDWQNVREQAKKILTLLGFDNLDIEYDRKEEYEMTNQGRKLTMQSIRTRLITKKNAR